MRSRLLGTALALLCVACHASRSSSPTLTTTPSNATGRWEGALRDQASNAETPLSVTMTEGSDGTVIITPGIFGAFTRARSDGYTVMVSEAGFEFDGRYFDGGNRLIGTYRMEVGLGSSTAVASGTFDLRRATADEGARGTGELVIVDGDGNVTRRTVTVLR